MNLYADPHYATECDGLKTELELNVVNESE